MKKIISVLVVALLLATSILAVVPASAATKTLEIDWRALAYQAYNDSGSMIDESIFFESIKITKDASTFKAERVSNSLNSNSYISTSQFAMTATTDYTYEVMAKNNVTTKYSGVPFAIDTEGYVYFIYGSFDNNNDSSDSQSGKSYVISAKGDFDNKYPNETGDELDSIYFAKLQQTDGFASFKFEYNGLTVSIYAKNTSGTYVKMGTDVTLPEGSKVAFGLFTRDASNNGNRTTTLKNAKITANNDEACANLVLDTNNGASDLRAEIILVEKEYLEVDYTKATYSAVKTAIENGKTIAEDPTATKEAVSAALSELQNAVLALELKDPDFAKLDAAIEKAEELNEVEWTSITYNMVVKAVEDAKIIKEVVGVKQSEVDAATADILGKIDALVSSGVIAEPEEDEDTDEDADVDEDADADANGDETFAPVIQNPIVQPPVATDVVADKGCKSAVATSAAIVALVATLGTALVIKKKD